MIHGILVQERGMVRVHPPLFSKGKLRLRVHILLAQIRGSLVWCHKMQCWLMLHFFIFKNVETYIFIIKYSVHVNFILVYTRNHYDVRSFSCAGHDRMSESFLQTETMRN
jgi:hypothetical protein